MAANTWAVLLPNYVINTRRENNNQYGMGTLPWHASMLRSVPDAVHALLMRVRSWSTSIQLLLLLVTL